VSIYVNNFFENSVKKVCMYAFCTVRQIAPGYLQLKLPNTQESQDLQLVQISDILCKVIVYSGSNVHHLVV